MTYNCNICNKEFLSNSGFWKHNKKYHNCIQNNDNSNATNINSNTIITKSINNKLECKYCNKLLSRIDNVTRHEKKCKIKYDNIQKEKDKEFLELRKEIDQLKLLLQKTMKIKPNILNKKNNNCNNTNTVNNIINMVPFGHEDLANIISNKQMFNFISKGGSCINESIKYIHFNDNIPQCKNIFITNFKDKYAYIFDGDTFLDLLDFLKKKSSLVCRLN